MKLPAALTWAHLFERGASFQCDARTSEPLRAALKQLDAPGNDSLPVAVGHELRPGAGFVGINVNISDLALQKAGYTYIRRFAVLPDLQTARWFVPLDSPAVSSAAFSLYSPARFTARLKVAAARLAAHTRLPVWYRDQIVVARTAPPPIERAIAQVFPGISFRLALSSGAPEPARNRKVSLAVIAADGKHLGFAKIAGSDLADRLVRHEAAALPALAQRGVPAPLLLFSGEVDGAFVTLQKPLLGKPVSLKLTNGKQALLRALCSGPAQPASESSFVATLPARLAELNGQGEELADALHEALPLLARVQAPSTIVHGDFAPWNLRESNGRAAAFDWEYAELDGLPLIDETHFRLQVGYLLKHWTIEQACAELKSMHLNSWSFEQVRAVHVVYLIDQLARLFSEGYSERDNEMVAWHCQLLRRLSPRRKEMALA